MKKMVTTLLFFFAFTVHADESDKMDIQVQYTNNSVATITANYIIKASPETAWSVISDQEGMPKFVPRLLYAHILGKNTVKDILTTRPDSFKKVLEKIKNDEPTPPTYDEKYTRNSPTQVTYYYAEEFNFPWPLSNRWLVIKCVQEELPKERTFSRKYEMLLGNLKTTEGGWHVTVDSENPEWSKVTYNNISNPGFQVPTFIGKSMAKKTSVQMLSAIRKKIESLTETK